jgi:hypothetical protein
MADEIRNGDSKARVVRLFGHRDDAGAWQIRDFLKRRSEHRADRAERRLGGRLEPRR